MDSRQMVFLKHFDNRWLHNLPKWSIYPFALDTYIFQHWYCPSPDCCAGLPALTLVSLVLSPSLGLILNYPMNCCPPGSSLHGILQARILEWVDIPFSRRSSRPRDWPRVPSLAQSLNFDPQDFFPGPSAFYSLHTLSCRSQPVLMFWW